MAAPAIVSHSAWRWPLSILLLVAALDAGITGFLWLDPYAQWLASFYYHSAALLVLVVAAMLAVTLLLLNAWRKQWPRVAAWLLVALNCSGSFLVGSSLFLRAVSH